MIKAALRKIKRRLACRHEWEILDRVGVYSEFGHDGDIYICSCPKCGKIKRIRT